jgi:hypothetical protein
MNYLQYAFYAINIYLEKVIEDFRWGNTCAHYRRAWNRKDKLNSACPNRLELRRA